MSTPAPRTAPHWLYRIFDADGRLLYIGVTVNVSRRIREHRNARWWREEIATWTVEGPFDGVIAGERAETEAIHAEKPRYAMSRREAGVYSAHRRWHPETLPFQPERRAS